MSERLEGKVAVITGAASGIGAATAKTYVEQGARVVLGDIQDQAGEALAASLGGSSHAVFRHCNVTSEAEVEALVEAAVSEFGQIDVMFNCAGIVGAVGPMSTTPADEWKLTIDIMINGVFYGMKHASRHMKEAGSGSIISMSSTAGLMGGAGPSCLYSRQACGRGHDQEPGRGVRWVWCAGKLYCARRHGHPHGSRGHYRRSS